METFSYYMFEMPSQDTQVNFKVRKGEKIRNRYNQVPHLTQDTNRKVTDSQLGPHFSLCGAFSGLTDK